MGRTEVKGPRLAPQPPCRRATTVEGRGVDGRGARKLPRGGGMPAVGQDDHRHQRVQQLPQRLGVLLEQPRVDHAEGSTHDTLRGQRRSGPAGSHTRPALIDRSLESALYLGATLEHPRPGTKRLHENEPAQRRFTIKETKQRPQARTDARGPLPPAFIRREHNRYQLVDRLVKGRQEAVFATGKQVIERLIRHTRAARDTPRRQPPVPTLRDDGERRVEQPHTLQLRHIHATTTRTRGTRVAYTHTPRGGHQNPPPKDGATREIG